MNKKITIAIITAIFTLGANAQPQCDKHGPTDGCKGKHEPMTAEQIAEKQTQRMTKDLNLTDEQQKQIMKLNLKNAQKHKAKMAKAEKKMAKAKEKRNKEMAKNAEQLKKIRTAEQYAKFQQKKEDMRKEHMKFKMERKKHGKCECNCENCKCKHERKHMHHGKHMGKHHRHGDKPMPHPHHHGKHKLPAPDEK